MDDSAAEAGKERELVNLLLLLACFLQMSTDE